MSDSEDDLNLADWRILNRPQTNRRTKKTNKKVKTVDENSPLEILGSYFTRSDDGIICNVVDCKSTVSRWQAYYFKRHFEKKHPTLLRELFPAIADNELKYEIDACNLMFSAVELVTVNGMPFSLLDAPAFRNILSDQINELEIHGHKVTINRHMIGRKVEEMADKVREQISGELKGKMLSLMFDICTKITFPVLGVSTTFMVDDTVFARSLGVIKLKERHKGPYLANVIEELLETYGVSLKQVHTVTTDMAKNMFNTARHLALHAYNGTNRDDLSPDIESVMDSNEDSNGSDDDRMELENEIELQNELDNDDRFADLIGDLTTDLKRRNNFLSLINHINCCAHGSQLAVNEAINRSDAREVISEVREMTKDLRKTVVNIEFRKLEPNCILPPKYVETRWNSDYEMVI